MWSDLTDLFLPAFWETLAMVGVPGGIDALFDAPLGVLLCLMITDDMLSAPMFNRVAGLIVNTMRSMSFIILLVTVVPFTCLLAGSSIGTATAIVSLTIAAVPFAARLVETTLREVDRGLIEAAQSMGATTGQPIHRVLLPGAMPGILAGLTIAFVSLTSYSAMAGTTDGDGLGGLSIHYGYRHYGSDIMLAVVVILIVFVQTVQSTGDWLVRHLSHR